MSGQRNVSCLAFLRDDSCRSPKLCPPLTSTVSGPGVFVPVPAKNSIDRKERPIHRGIKGSRDLLSGRGLQISWPCELEEGPVPSAPESSRISADSRSEHTPLESANDFSSRPPFIAVMQSTDLRQFNDRPQLRWLNRSGLRCIFLQRQGRARPVVIIEIRFERASQRRFVEHD